MNAIENHLDDPNLIDKIVADIEQKLAVQLMLRQILAAGEYCEIRRLNRQF